MKKILVYILIALCMLNVGCVSGIINMSRFYGMALFFIAPLFVLGCEFIGEKVWIRRELLKI